LSEFGAFSGSDSTTTTIIKHEYTYILPNGTKITSDVEDPSISKSIGQKLSKDTVLLGSTLSSTSESVTSSTTIVPDFEGPGK